MQNQSGTALLQSVSRLIRLLEQETRLLQAMRPKEVDGLQNQKAALVSDYQEKLTALAATPEALRGLAPAVRQELTAAAAALQSATEENARTLTAAKLATDQLVHSIAAAVLEEQRIQNHYRADGQNGHSAAGSPMAVSINEVL